MIVTSKYTFEKSPIQIDHGVTAYTSSQEFQSLQRLHDENAIDKNLHNLAAMKHNDT